MSSSTARPDPAPPPAPGRLVRAVPVRENIVLTGPDPWHEKRHIGLDLVGSGLSYTAGDTLGILPRNEPRVVDALLEALGIATDAPVQPGAAGFGAALAQQVEIAIASPKFLRTWAMLSGSAELTALAAPDNTEARRHFLKANHIVDIVRRHAVAGLEPKTVLAGLRPLQPRLFSLASSPILPGPAAILTSTLRYRLHGEVRRGTVSGYQLPAALPGTLLSAFVEPCPDFRLPADDMPIIMVGAGTGVAPFRAFLAERRARGASGRNWMIFGERHRTSDYLYGDMWEAAHADGTLTRLDLAFSRDQPEKHYVQHCLLQHGRAVYDWLEHGATLYVCGDAAGMAPAVHAALLEIIAQHAGTDHPGAITRLRALAADHRYRRSIY